jgi:D-alanyl-D-alanine dipeptidase
MELKNLFLFISAMILINCSCSNSSDEVILKKAASRKLGIIVNRKTQQPMTLLEKSLLDAGLMDVSLLDSNILVDLKYSTTDNFLGIDLYGDFNKAYLQLDVAEKLFKAQQFMSELKPGYHLLIFDAARPQSIQQKFWDTLKMPVSEKVKFVANPKYGSLHNFGAAVDVSIADKNKIPLDMGCPYDFIGELAYSISEEKLFSEGKLTRQQIDNRKLLRMVMYKAGFFNIQTEWWHFNSCYREEAVEKYEMIK